MSKNDSIDTIYNYTESLIKAQEDSLVRLNAKSSTFIGFAGVLIRLSIDLPKEEEMTRVAVCFFGIVSIILGAIGLTAKMTGSVLHPVTLLKDEYLNEDEFVHQFIIIKDRIELIQEYELLMKKKQKRINLMIFSFCSGIIFYGVGIIKYGDLIINQILNTIKDFIVHTYSTFFMPLHL